MESIKWPKRQVVVTFTHETAGDNWFGPMMAAAYAEYRAALAASPEAFSPEWYAKGGMSDTADFRASNGVLLQFAVPEMTFDE